MAHAFAVDTLFEEHRRFLWGLCYRMTGSAADADDVVQDTFVRVMERPPRRLDEALRPWLVKVALTLARQQASAAALKQFLHALQEHDVASIETLLADDVRTTTDGGGEFRSALRTITGRDKVVRFYLAVSENAAHASVRAPMLNGMA